MSCRRRGTVSSAPGSDGTRASATARQRPALTSIPGLSGQRAPNPNSRTDTTTTGHQPGGTMTTDLRAVLQDQVERGHARVVEWRRTIHAHPELAYQEHQTADLAARVLRELGAEVRTGLAGTGLVGLVKGRGPG